MSATNLILYHIGETMARLPHTAYHLGHQSWSGHMVYVHPGGTRERETAMKYVKDMLTMDVTEFREEWKMTGAQTGAVVHELQRVAYD